MRLHANAFQTKHTIVHNCLCKSATLKLGALHTVECAGSTFYLLGVKVCLQDPQTRAVMSERRGAAGVGSVLGPASCEKTQHANRQLGCQ